MGWDGVPEHRGLRGEGEQPSDAHMREQRRQEYLARINAYRATRQQQNQQYSPHPAGASSPVDPQMPPDPFAGTLPGAIAQAEMLRSLLDGGMTEPQALYYMACLLQVGLAMRMGHFPGDLPPWPPDST